jgi:thiamine biosynthesis lipoprotein
MQTLEFRAMNSAVLLAAEDAGQMGADLGPDLQAARLLIEQSEERFSRFLPASELSRLNDSAGEWHDVSQDLLDLLKLSRDFMEETGGLFDPSILTDLKRAGYDRSMDEIRKDGFVSSGGPRPNSRPDFRQVEIDFDRRRVRLPAGMEIDLGGIAKGWIVERAAMLLSSQTSACAVSAGGDIVCVGFPVDGANWRVSIEDPLDSAQSVAEVQMGPGAIVTSSVAKRSWKQAGVPRHHLIDPRTGEPAASDWLSVTVVSPRITTAEVYAKALLIGGAAQAPRLASQRPEITYYAVARDGTVAENPHKVEHLNELHQIFYQ